MANDLPPVKIGILGGTGLYEMEGITGVREIVLETPFGPPSDPFIVGKLEGQPVAFLSRHGRGHRYLPSEINYRANIFGFKKLGVERIISVNSCGSLKEEIKPLDIVLSDQFFDRTYKRRNTFFGEGLAAHISFADPVCPELAGILHETAQKLELPVHLGGTYICIEGPSFSTKAESKIYKRWGCDVIGMTSVTEARLCREAEICYATMNLVTDYDVWHEVEEGVSVALILKNLQKNIENAKRIIRKALSLFPEERGSGCMCREALRNALVTHKEFVSPKKRMELSLLIGKYMNKSQS